MEPKGEEKVEWPANAVEPDPQMARIVRITKISSIEKATNVELAHVLGWKVVVAKADKFKEGDLAIYFCINTLFHPEYEKTKFLKGKPLKTKKFLGITSQGLLAPLTWLNDVVTEKELLAEGDDVTLLFPIRKHVYDEEVTVYKPREGKKPGTPFPSFINKTDEPRIQNMPSIVEELKDVPVVITLKLDGTSATYYTYKGEFHICSRNFVLESPETSESHYWAMEKEYDIERGMQTLKRDLAIQGEICGPKIGGNRMKLAVTDFAVFNIWDISAQAYLPYEEVVTITDQLSLNRVPLLHQGPFEFKSVEEVLDFADKQEYSKGNPAEGIVVKTGHKVNEPRTSFKAIANRYLLKHNH